MGVVRWMYCVELEDGVPGGELIERLGLDDMVSVLQRGRLQWGRWWLSGGVWSMGWRVPDQEVDQRKLGEIVQGD